MSLLKLFFLYASGGEKCHAEDINYTKTADHGEECCSQCV